MANSLAACLHSVGFEMPRVHDAVPLLDVDGVVEALTARLQVLAVCVVLVQRHSGCCFMHTRAVVQAL